jgi:hypothetical protein
MEVYVAIFDRLREGDFCSWLNSCTLICLFLYLSISLSAHPVN